MAGVGNYGVGWLRSYNWARRGREVQKMDYREAPEENLKVSVAETK